MNGKIIFLRYIIVIDVSVRVIDCHVVYINKNNEKLFLSLKRNSKERYPNIWQCITGGIINKEKPEQTAIRELFEETGLTPKKMWSIETVNYYYDPKYGTMNIIPVFGVQVNNMDIKISEEHQEYTWETYTKVESLLFWKQQKIGLKTFLDMLNEGGKKLLLSEITV